MKTFKSTLNTYLATCFFILATTLVALLLEPLAPYRNALCSTLGLANGQLWILVVPLSLAVLLTISIRLRAELTNPIRTLTEQCSFGLVTPDTSHEQTREIRVIREFIRQSQNRADIRANQISQMEAALINTRKQNERYVRKVEELEDLIASYGRIRNELNYDNSLLRQESQSQATQIKVLETQLARERVLESSSQTFLSNH